jgi:hypothetical protein
LYAKKVIQLFTRKTKKSKLLQKKATTEKLQKLRKDLKEEEKEESEEVWMLENDKNANQENVDFEVVGILAYKEKQTTSDSRKEIFYMCPSFFVLSTLSYPLN